MTQIMKSLNEMTSTDNKWAVIAVDETQYWQEETQKKGKKIEGVYLVNLQQPTHLCELAVSYPAYFLKNYFQETEGFDEDEITELEMENGDEEIRYFSGNFVPRLIKYYKEGDEDEIMEYEAGNPSCC